MNWFLFRNLIKHDLNEPSEDDKTKPSKNTILQKLLPTQESWSKLPSTHWPLLFSLYNITLHGRYLTLLPPIHLSMIIGKNKHHSTMLQKLSKCEVKTWLCWNLILLPPLRFYVKSYFGEFRRSKNVIFGNFRLWT